VPVDIALAQDKDSLEITMHTANCPTVRKMEAEGHPVMTLIGCEHVPENPEYAWHSCLTIMKATNARPS